MESNTHTDIVAVETHNGRIWSLIVVLALIVPTI